MRGITKRKSKAQRRAYCDKGHTNVFSENSIPTRRVICGTKGCQLKVIIPAKLT